MAYHLNLAALHGMILFFYFAVAGWYFWDGLKHVETIYQGKMLLINITDACKHATVSCQNLEWRIASASRRRLLSCVVSYVERADK